MVVTTDNAKYEYKNNYIYEFFKRIFDFVGFLIALILLGWLILLLCIIKFCEEGLNEVDGPAFKMKNDPRITKFGKFLRKTSLDELPQI